MFCSFCLPVYAVGYPQFANSQKSAIEGAIDFHIHSSPDVIPRRLDDFEVAKLAARSHMKAVVLKNHFASTAARAVLVNKIVPQIEVFGGIVLNHSVGGMNPQAVEAMHRIGGKYGKIVWLPTVDADYHLQVFHKSGIGIKVAKNGKVLPETEAVLQIVARDNLVLETGHISPTEVMVVVERSYLLNIKNILITHAMADVPGLSLENMQTAAQMGAFLELAFVNDLMGENAADEGHRNWHQVSIDKMVAAIKLIGAEHFVLSTDLGRKPDPLPAEGYELFVKKLMNEGISQPEIDLMMKQNPARLLGI
ncbi:MAG: histidinol phosphatase [Microcoleus sp. CSU_2_2]|nr:histidinol phosphatase [Microcoleus sp. SU_5_3]NJS09385.1 histidinol phosphatase [Microcoleus sp. CSU_2_2]